MPDKLFIVESRILELMDRVLTLSIKGVNTQAEFCRIAGIQQVAIREIKMGKRGFTTRQILNLQVYFGVNLYYIFGLSDNMFPDGIITDTDPIEYLKQAVILVEARISPRTNTGKSSSAKKEGAKKVAK